MDSFKNSVRRGRPTTYEEKIKLLISGELTYISVKTRSKVNTIYASTKRYIQRSGLNAIAETRTINKRDYRLTVRSAEASK